MENAKPVRQDTYDAAETTLGWTAGSCRKILDGGEPSLVDPEPAGGHIAVVPPETLEAEVRDALQGALIATTDDLTASQIRRINERAIEVLRARGILPPKD